jgi:hypothetical protein
MSGQQSCTVGTMKCLALVPNGRVWRKPQSLIGCERIPSGGRKPRASK